MYPDVSLLFAHCLLCYAISGPPFLQVAELKEDDVVCVIKNSATLAGSLFTLHISQIHIDLPTLSDADKDVSRFYLVSL